MQNYFYIDSKYLNLISTKLKRFQKKNDNLWNCRCPFCGDSKKNQNKARGYFFKKENKILYKCHNCDIGLSLKKVLKLIDSSLYERYNLELFGNKKNSIEKKVAPAVVLKTEEYVQYEKIDLPSILDLPNNHLAKKYVLGRKIPEKFYNKLFYAESYRDWIAHYDSIGKYSKIQSDERLVIPVFDVLGKVVGAQGRTLTNSSIRYISCKWTDDIFFYGLERWEPFRKTYLVEGPIDSMFLPNSIACMSSDFVGCVRKLKEKFQFDSRNLVLVFDNEKRKPEIQSKLKSAIDCGYNVCVWPNSLKEKDINDMILSNLQAEDIVNLINTRTFKDLFAQIEFAATCKIALTSK